MLSLQPRASTTLLMVSNFGELPEKPFEKCLQQKELSSLLLLPLFLCTIP